MSETPEQRLAEAQKLDALARVSGGVAHDFNNLLTVILSYVSMLREAPPDTKEALDADLAAIDEAARAAVDLTTSLLVFGRRQGGRPISLDLAEWLGHNRPELDKALGAGITLDATIADGTGAARIDPTHALRLFRELCKNAKDVMPQGGTVRLEASPVTLDDAFVAAHPGAQKGPHVKIVFSDCGTGITPEARLRLFEPFFSTKGRGKGAGLGLAMVYGIVRQNNGTIWVDNAPGARFEIYLPA